MSVLRTNGPLVWYFSEPSIVGCRDPDQHDPTDFPHSGPTSTDQVHVQNSPTDTANNVSLPIYSPFASDLQLNSNKITKTHVHLAKAETTSFSRIGFVQDFVHARHHAQLSMKIFQKHMNLLWLF